MMCWCFFCFCCFFFCVKFLVWSFGWELEQQYKRRAASIRYRVFAVERLETCVALWGWHAKMLFFFPNTIYFRRYAVYLCKQVYWMCTSLSISTFKALPNNRDIPTYKYISIYYLLMSAFLLWFCSINLLLKLFAQLVSSLLQNLSLECLNYDLTVTKCIYKDVFVSLRDLYVVWWRYFGCGCTL